MRSLPQQRPATGASEPRHLAVAGSWRVELLPRRPYEAAYTPRAPVIGFAFDSQAGVHAFGGDRRMAFRAKPNGLAYVPAGCDVYSRSDDGGEYLRIALARDRSGSRQRARRFSDVIDPVAIAAAHDLRRLLLSGERIDVLHCEPCVHALAERVDGVLAGCVVVDAAASWMTPRRLRHIDELIEARLDARLTVTELASSLGLSAGFFSRAFKAAVGKAPHAHIIDRRVARARALLGRTELGLAAIAQASGFASHAHMTATFRHRLGASPRALRGRSKRCSRSSGAEPTCG